MVVDLIRPASEQACEEIVTSRAAQEPEQLQKDFFHSLKASYEIAEVNSQLHQAGLSLSCQPFSDIHWVVSGTIPGDT